MKHLFETGKIRVLEKRLPNQTDIDRMIAAESFEKTFQILNDTDLSDNLLHIQPNDFEKAIIADMIQMRDFIKNISNGQNLFHFLFLKYDFHNIKVLLKSKILQDSNYRQKLIPFSVYPFDIIENYILLNNQKALSSGFLKNFLNRVLKKFSLEIIDDLCDKEYFRLLLNIAKKINNKFIINLAILEIDFANLKIVLRSEKPIKDLYLSGGNLKLAQLIKIHSEKEEGVVKYLKFYLKKSELVIFREYFEERQLWQFEKAFDNLLIAYLKKSKMITAGPFVIVGYVLAKEIAFRNIRIIMTAKLNGISSSIIKERVRNTY